MDKPKRVNNAEGETLCLVRYTVETPAGPLSAWNEEIFAAYEAQIRADEREACAKVCIEWGETKVAKWSGTELETEAKARAWDGLLLAAAIRERD